MSTSATEAVAGGIMAGYTAGPSSQPSNTANKDTFLQLLVAQLRYQDPMNPTDSSQFLSQSAQFTALEKMEDVATKTAQALAAQMAFGASSLVGRTVSYSESDGTTGTGTVGAVRFTPDGPILEVGDDEVALSTLQSVSADIRSTDGSQES